MALRGFDVAQTETGRLFIVCRYVGAMRPSAYACFLDPAAPYGFEYFLLGWAVYDGVRIEQFFF